MNLSVQEAQPDAEVPEPRSLVLAGDLCASRASFEALGFQARCLPGTNPALAPRAEEVLFLSASDWESARWHAPGARLVVVGELEDAEGGVEILLPEHLDAESVQAVLEARDRRYRAIRSAGWLAWARAGLESARAIHDLNNALSRVLALAEVGALQAPETLEPLVGELLQAGGIPREIWDRISAARSDHPGARASTALWDAITEFPWSSATRPCVRVEAEPAQALKATLPEARVLADTLLELLDRARAEEPTFRLAAGAPPGEGLDFADRRALKSPSDLWLELDLSWSSEAPDLSGLSQLPEVVCALQGCGRWGPGSSLTLWLPLRPPEDPLAAA